MRAIRSIPDILSIALFLLGASIPITASAGEAPSIEQLSDHLKAGDKTTRIVCFGDSITGVYYHSGSARAWTDMLGIALQQAYPKAQLEMVNAGISGNTTINALARIEKDVLSRKPDLVVVMFGMNDVVRVPIEDYEKNLRNIVRQCRESGAAVMLCTPNSVIENPGRPNAKLAAYSDRVRIVARDSGTPLVDCFRDWTELHKKDETAWMLLMSETIHPNMNGHKRFAELIAQSLSGEPVSLANVVPASDPLFHTRKRLAANQPVKLVAAPPYDTVLPAALKKGFPEARIEIISWPVKDLSLAGIRKWSERIRNMTPHLVAINVPPAALEKPSETDFIRDFQWILNNSFPFGKRQWDIMSFLPVNGAVSAERLYLAREAIKGKDIAPLTRMPDDLIAE